MAKAVKVSVSILCADFTNLEKEILKCEEAGVDIFHIDVMDGHFVPNITIGPLIIEALRSKTKLPIEAHLMIERPSMFIDPFLKAGADIISLHAECYAKEGYLSKEADGYTRKVDAIDVAKVAKDIKRIKDNGKKVAMVLNPGSPLCVEALLNDLDGVLIMSVNPGFAKQKFMPVALPKIQKLREMYDGDIAVDGGINQLTAPEAVKAGANILATASYFFSSDKPKETIQYLRNLGGTE